MIITPTSIAEVLLIQPARYGDERGWFCETYNAALMESHGLPRFQQDNESLSLHEGTIRGLHFQRRPYSQAKLVRCVRGAIFDVALDIRPTSPTFGQHVETLISAEGGEQILIPAGFAHGFCTLGPDTIVHYKVSLPYSPSHQDGVRWNDPSLEINWPARSGAPTLSSRDQSHLTLAELDLSDV